MGLLTLCRFAVGVFYSHSQLGNLSVDDIDSKNVRVLLDSHSKDLNDEDLGIEHQLGYEAEERENEVENISKEMTVKKPEELVQTTEKAIYIILEMIQISRKPSMFIEV